MKQYNIQASIRVTEFFETKVPTPEKLGAEVEKFLRTQVPGAFRNEVLITVEVREVPAVIKTKSSTTKPKAKCCKD